MDGRRPCLQSSFFDSCRSTAHTGLWLDKYLHDSEKGKGEEKAKHFTQAVRPVDSLYGQFYARWEKLLAEIGVQTRPAKVLGRLAIGLGGESVLETAISLHRTYGVPFIPGSALKGLAAHYAAKRLGEKWHKASKAHRIVFGDTNIAGFVTFYDALYIPDSANYGQHKNTPLALDVINVHHPEYYRGNDAPPADWDSPTPVSFLSATGSYLLAVHGPDEWAEAAFKILALALAEEGIGAKTSSGYGRMEIEGFSTQSTFQADSARATPPLPLPPGYRRGTVKSFGLGPNKSYGYIEVQGMQDVFVHRNDLAGSLTELQPSQQVIFRIRSEKGKTQAEDVSLDE